MLEMKNVSKVYGGGFMRGPGNTALNDMSFAIGAETASITAIAGESGSGKTTLARLLLGFIQPTTGQILYNGRDITNLTRLERKAYRREVQAILQDPFESFNPFYRIDHVLSLPISKFGLASSRDEARHLMETALTSVGLRPQDTLGRYPHQLSGGQRQRVMVARTVLLRPRIILADEPVSMVDASLRATILESLLKLHQEQQISILYITHDLNTAYQVAENIMVLYRGRVVETGDVDSVIKHPKHPYTQLLVNSIPSPDVTRRWRDEVLDAEPAEAQELVVGRPDVGCAFASRCPQVMPQCTQAVPPLYLAQPDQGAACYLYRERPQVSPAELSSMHPQQVSVSSARSH